MANFKKALELFFDIENIAFSHLNCNIKAATRMKVNRKLDRYRGVSYDSSKSRKKRWRAIFDIDNKFKVFGRCKTEKEAAELYDREVTKILGDEAVTNKSLGLL